MITRTLQGVRQAVYAALTSPLLQYTINANAPVTLPAANVIPRAVWLTGGAQAPMPLVAFSVAGLGVISRTLGDRVLRLRFWCVSSSGPDEATELYEAVRARIHTADSDFGSTAPNLSRAATGSTLGVAVRECVEQRASDVDYEATTSRWYVTAEYRVFAA